MLDRVGAVARRVAERMFRRAPQVAGASGGSVPPRRTDSHRIAYGIAAGLAAMAACKTYTPPDVISDVPASVADAGSSDAAVTAAVRELTHAPVTSIFKAGVNSTPLKVNQSTEISFALPQELKDLFGKVKSFGIIGTRMDQNNRSPFSIDGFKEEDGTVSASIKPLRGAFSSAEDAGNTWHLVVGLGEGEEAKYAWYEFVVAGRTTSDDAGTRDVRRREDAGTTERDIPRPPREVTTREAGVRIRP